MLVTHAFRAARRALGLPRGIGILLDRRTRLRLVLAVSLGLVIAALEVVALAAILPLMTLLQDPTAHSRAVTIVGDAIGTHDANHLAIAFAIIVLGLYVVKAFANIAYQWWQVGFIQHEQVKTARLLFDHYLRAPYAFHLRRTTADLVSTMNDAVGQVYVSVVNASLMALADLLTIVAIMVTLLVIMPLPTLAAVGYFLSAALLFQRWAKPRSLAYGRAQIEGSIGIFRAATEGLGNVKLVLLRATQPYFVGRYTTARTLQVEAQRRAGFITALPKHILEVLFVVGIGVMTGLVLLQGSGPSALTSVALFAAAGFRTLPSIVRFLGSMNSMRVGRFSVDKVLADVNEALATVVDPADEGSAITFRREVGARSVSYTYPASSTEVLHTVDLTLPFGSSTALVGPSGAGKSTLVDLLQGLLDPTHGQILVDGMDIRTSLQSWRRQVGSVPQDVVLIEGSLRQNVAFGLPQEEIDDQAVLDALQQAQLGDLINGLPDGIDTAVGERGSRLSGGQRQRLGIARALYGSPPLLVFDEATSALDNETEHRITQTLAELRGRTTLVVVAHRLSTVRHCDRIVYLEEGRLEAIGTFDELSTTHAAFARLVALGQLT